MKTKGFDSNAKRILIFLGITFGITYLYEIGVVGRLLHSGNKEIEAVGQLLVAMAMFIPAISVAITRLITKEGFADSWIRPNLKGNVKYYLFAWFGPVVLTILGAILYFLLFPDELTFDMEYLATAYKANGVTLEASQLRGMIAGQAVIAILLAPVMNAVTCLGEEWGWRGYLLPKMSERFRIIPMLLIYGVIWGLWHAPLTVLGHNYGLGYAGYPYLGIIAMCIFCIVMGTIFSYVSLKTKSCLPAVIAHGSINGFASIAVYFSKDGGNPFIGPAPTGIIGAAAFIITAIVLTVLLVREEKG
ncbi:MAG: CPBP family intramembrane metalloprotease [Lachnospiraceae bacterium]|nr:CPBP family intramembrane metalloprotease [Lachnospiraceae bacterium]